MRAGCYYIFGSLIVKKQSNTALDNTLIQNAFKLSLKTKRFYFFPSVQCCGYGSGSFWKPRSASNINKDPDLHQSDVGSVTLLLSTPRWSHYLIGKAKAWIWVGRPQPVTGMAGINYLNELILDDLHVVWRWFAMGRRGRGRGRRYLQHLSREHQPRHPCISTVRYVKTIQKREWLTKQNS